MPVSTTTRLDNDLPETFMKSYVKPIKKDIHEDQLFIEDGSEDLHEDRNKDTV